VTMWVGDIEARGGLLLGGVEGQKKEGSVLV
jgi:hypothetical protein